MKRLILLLTIFTGFSYAYLGDPESCNSCENGYMEYRYTRDILPIPNHRQYYDMRDIIDVPPSRHGCAQLYYIYTYYTIENLVEREVSNRVLYNYDIQEHAEYYFCVANPTCDENQTLDTSVYPPECKDNCDQNDTSFPNLNPYEEIKFTWVLPETRSIECTDINGTVQSARVDCEDQYRCVVSSLPTCNEDEVLDINVNPPVCVPNCTTPNTDFPALEENEEANLYWSGNADLSAECTELNGKIQSRIINCETEYRCVTQRCMEPDNPFPELAPNERIKFTWAEGDTAKADECNQLEGKTQSQKIDCENSYRCICTNTDFPWLTANQKILFEWSGESSEKSAQCIATGGKEQSATFGCVTQNRCIKVTEEEKKEKDECIASYVSPSDSTFHEDITLTGVDFALHYNSGNIDDNGTQQQIAQGWSFSNHASFDEETNRLYLGSGSLWVVEPYQEENFTVVKSGSSELLFDEDGRHISTRDFYTKEVESTFTYDSNDLLISITNMYNEVTTIHRDNEGIISNIVSPYGQVTYLAIDNNDDLVEVQYEDTSSYTFEYEDHLMTIETEPNGNAFLHFFDEQGKVVKVIDAEQGEWDFGVTTDTTSGTTTVTKASGDTITYTSHFLENGLLKTQKELPTGDIVLYEHTVDDTQNATTMCGVKTENVYKTNPDGSLYQDLVTDKRVLQQSITTTPSGLTKTTNYTKNYTFGANNSIVSIENITTTSGASTTSIRDYNQSTQTVTSAEGIITQSTFDPVTQNILTTQYANFLPTTFTYDAKGRVIQTTQGERTTTSSYDEKGNRQSITDAKGKTTTYGYDTLNRLTQVTYPDQTSEIFDYDSNGNQIKRVVPTPADHTFTYNGVNKQTAYTSPMQSTTTYSYDKQRRVTKVTKPSHKTIETTYTNGRVESISTQEGTSYYSYECQNNISQISKEDESISFSYDGDLITSMTQSGVLEQTLNFSYNSDFLLQSFSYAGDTEHYTYNKDQELMRVNDYTLTRDTSNGLVTELTDGTLKQKRTYNEYGELSKQSDDVLSYQLQRDEIKIIKKTEFITRLVEVGTKGKGNSKPNYKKEKVKVSYEYHYDQRDRLIEVYKDRELVEQYSYDNNGNRASANVYGTVSEGSYTLDDNLVVYGQNSYRYDEDGYLEEKTTSQGTTTYSYGTLGELIEVSTPDKTITYRHNANNQRVAKLIDGEVIEKYLWADLTTLLAIFDKEDTLIQRFEYVDQRMPVSMTDANGTKYYLHYDQVGSLRAVSRVLSPDNTDPSIVKEISYDSYGNILEDSNTDFKIPFGFAGGLYDPDTKLTRFGYRDYDAYTGKWTAKDPIGFDGGDSNLYGYVLQDPVNGIDPVGLMSMRVPRIMLPRTGNLRTGKGIDLKNPKTWPKPPVEGECKVGSPSRVKPRNRGEKSLYDSKGGEWRPQHPDKYHPDGHWNYKPAGNNQPWKNIDAPVVYGPMVA